MNQEQLKLTQTPRKWWQFDNAKLGFVASIASIGGLGYSIFQGLDSVRDVMEAVIAFFLLWFSASFYADLRAEQRLRQQDQAKSRRGEDVLRGEAERSTSELRQQNDQLTVALATANDLLRRNVETATHLHSIIHNVRNEFFFFPASKGSKDRARSSVEKMNGLLVGVLALTREAYEAITGTKVATCIKLNYYSDPLPYKVKTLLRDPLSAALRGGEDTRLYELSPKNTDFYLIAQDQVRYFFSNDLIALSQQTDVSGRPKYENQHEGWQKLYKSSIVFPIRGYPPGNEGKKAKEPVLYGYLAIDANQTGVFSEELSFQTGAAIADFLWILFHRNGNWIGDMATPV